MSSQQMIEKPRQYTPTLEERRAAMAIRAAAWVLWLPTILSELFRSGWLTCRVIYWRGRLRG